MSSDQHSPQGSIDIVIYYADGSGVLLKVNNGQNQSAGYLFDLVLDELEVEENLQRTIREVFSLWLVSDLLELQLKPDHVPFKLVCFWEEFLMKYTTAEEYILERDEPILVFRRNVFAKLTEEMQIENETLLGLLYAENLGNVLKGRYGGTRSNEKDRNYQFGLNDNIGAKLAAIQAAILFKKDKKENIDSFGTTQYFKSNLKNFLPTALCKRNLIFNRDSNPEVAIANEYAKLRSENSIDNEGNISPTLSLSELYTKYLDICRNFFFYESGFFIGQAEHPGKKVDDPVIIAVNYNGVSIIDLDDQVWLLSLPYNKFIWKYAAANDSAKTTNTKEKLISMPCIFLQWEPPNEGKYKLLQIFTKSAPLIDNLIEAFSKLGQQQPKDKTDGRLVVVGNCELSRQFQKLAINTYDKPENQLSSSIDTKSMQKSSPLIV